MDSLDSRLLNLLQTDCSLSLAELGDRVGLSISGVKDRLRRMRARGDVRAYVALIDPRAAGYGLCAFVQVAVEGQKNERAFVAAMLKLPEVEECHRVSGELPCLLKLWANDLGHLERLIEDKIKPRGGVARVQASIVLSSPKDHVTGLTARG